MLQPSERDREQVGMARGPATPAAHALPDEWSSLPLSNARDQLRTIMRLQIEIEKIVDRYGLQYFPQHFELVTTDELNIIAARGGFPTRYPHWRFGMEYYELSKTDTYGLARIAELVINNNPCIAYLRKDNSLVDQLTVMAHVYAHNDFFKNNLYFAHTNRTMLNSMGDHATMVRRHADAHGIDAVEAFIDVCLSLETLIDPFHYSIRRGPDELSREEKERNPRHFHAHKLPAKPYMDRFVNPPQALKDEEQRLREEHAKKSGKFPASPQRDVMGFLGRHADLEDWQRDILEMIREEAYYFQPQGQTKIMNEGWASYWHSTLMTKEILKHVKGGLIDYADHNSQVLLTQPGRLNPYKLGVTLLRDIEERWNKGRFGLEYEQCDDPAQKAVWDKKLGLGREKIFQVRKVYNDVMFVDEFLTPEFCERQKLFTFRPGPDGEIRVTGSDFKKIKTILLNQLTNFGRPELRVVDGNYGNRRELCLEHRYRGEDLDLGYAQETMKNLWTVWKRPVHVMTKNEKGGLRLTYDGTRFESVKV